MADNTQAQTLTLSNGNAAQNQYLGYYNQLIKQIGGNVQPISYNNVQVADLPTLQAIPQSQQSLQSYYSSLQRPDTIQSQMTYNLPTITAPTLQPLQTVQGVSTNAPQMLEYRDIAAPAKITPQQIQIEEQNQEDLARQVSAYLRPYVDNAINARNKALKQERANIDVNANSRGMTPSTWALDMGNRANAQAQSDIAAMENEYLGNLGQQVFNSYQNYLERAKEVAMQNAILDFNAQNANSGYESSTAQFNERNRLDVGDTNIRNMMAWEDANANRLQAARTNNAEWANSRASEIGRYDYETQVANAANAATLLELQQRAVTADNANAWNYFTGLYNAGAADIADERARNEYLTQAQNQAQLAYWEALNRANEVNAAGQFDAAQANNSLQTQLMQLAMQYAGQLQGMKDSGGGRGGFVDNSGVTYTPGPTIPDMASAGTIPIKKAQAQASSTIANGLNSINAAIAAAKKAASADSGTTPVMGISKGKKNELFY